MVIRRLGIGVLAVVGCLVAAVGGAALWWTIAFAPDREVVYRAADSGPLVLELFEPSRSGSQVAGDAPAPAILFFFGGGWTGGSTWQFRPFARELSKRGWLAMVADYRVYSRDGTTAFTAADDAVQAVHYLHRNAHELGLDPKRIVLAGGSAGGHLAAVAGIIAPAHAAGPPAPAALVLLNPALDTKIEGEDHPLKAIAHLFEGRGEEISPHHHVQPGGPPTLVVHGTADAIIPFETAERFCERMRAADNLCELRLFEGEQHGFFNYGVGSYDEVLAEVVAFLEETVL